MDSRSDGDKAAPVLVRGLDMAIEVAELVDESAVGRRVWPRNQLPVMLDMRGTDGSWIRVHARNISATGLQISSFPDSDRFEEVRVRIPRFGSFAASLRWRRRDALGYQFARPLHPAVLDSVGDALQDRRVPRSESAGPVV
jgi:hypothetical protein